MNRFTLALALLAAAPLVSGGCGNRTDASSSAPVTVTTEDDKTLYALGLIVGRNIGGFNLTPAELNVVKLGITDSVTGKKPQVEIDAYGPKVGQLNRARQAAKAEIEKGKAKEFLAAAAKESGAVALPSGLVFKTLTPGNGPQPIATDRVKVHYNGTLTDGTVFDSSIKRGQPADFALNGVIPCWTEGVQRMKVGEKAKLVCPSSIAYGDTGRPPTIPGGATLVFDIELLGIEKPTAGAGGMPGMPMGGQMGGQMGGAMGGPHGGQMGMPPGHGMPPGMMPPGHGMPPGSMPPGHGAPPAPTQTK